MIHWWQVSVPINIISKAHGESDMLFERIDTNQDGVITYEELMAAMQSDPQIHEKIQGIGPILPSPPFSLLPSPFSFHRSTLCGASTGLLMKSEVSTLFKGSIRKVDFSS